MKKVIISISLILFFYLSCLAWLLLNLTPKDVILGATTSSFNYIPQSIFFYDLKYFVSIDTDEEKSKILHFILAGCTQFPIFKPNCKRAFDEIISRTTDLNYTSKEMPLTLLHEAALYCHPYAVKFLLKNGAKKEPMAGEGKFYQMTPLSFFKSLKNSDCEHKDEIRGLLAL